MGYLENLVEIIKRQKMYFLASVQDQRRIVESTFKHNTYYVYVDGSYRNDIGVGYGAVIMKGGRVIHQIVGNFQNIPLALQSLGEFTAVIKSVEWCEQQKARKIIVHYDCEGIRHLANKWCPSTTSKAKLQGPYQNYHEFMKPRLTQSGCHIQLRKVKAHSCDFMNNWADRLAKMGLYRLTVAQVRKEVGLPRQTGKHLLRMLRHIESNPLEFQYA